GRTFSLSMPPTRAKIRWVCCRWLSEIEKPPSTEATPSITPRAWSTERPGLSRISIQASCRRARNAPENTSGRLFAIDVDHTVADLDLALGEAGDAGVVGHEEHGVARRVQLA